MVFLTLQNTLFCFFFFLFGIVSNNKEACFLRLQVLFPSTLIWSFYFLPLWCSYSAQFWFTSRSSSSVWSLVLEGKELYWVYFESSHGVDCSSPFSSPQWRYSMVITYYGRMKPSQFNALSSNHLLAISRFSLSQCC